MSSVSVIVTTFNRKELLKETVTSILNQTYKDFELIIVDNYSKYDFFGLIESFKDTRIKAYQHANSGIIAVNRNFGIKKAVGKYIAFCDDDDFWFPNKLQSQIELVYDKNLLNDNFVIYSNCINVYQKSKKKTNSHEIKNINDLFYSNPITLSSTLVSNINSQISFNVDPKLCAVEDYDLWLKLKNAGYKFIIIKEPLLYYTVSHNSASKTNYGRNHIQKISIVSSFIAMNPQTKINPVKLFYVFSRELIKFLIKKILNEYYFE